ncbi:MAG: hypothetical protein MPN21_05935 [Thermoanaerobaculia bacterium]|nr:hypothetical protein [Thermoanaerobaculia bacterium]
MKNSHSRGIPAWLLPILLVCCVGVLPALAQDEDADPEPSETEEVIDEGMGDLGAFGEQAVDFGAVDELLEQDSEVMSDPGTYSYDPGARRDPFRSLVQRAPDPDEDRERPEGVPGLLVDEIAVQGIFMLPEGPVAQVVSTSQDTSFLIRPGDQLWDGEVVSMTLNEVVFKQDTDDPNSLKPFREVVKKLDPRV